MKKISTSDLRLNPGNPRSINDKKFLELKRSLQSFPEMMKLRPIVIDSSGLILGGNMRYRALIDLGYNELPQDWVIRADELTDEQKNEFIVKDNISFGAWDWDVLANEWDQDSLMEWGLDLPGLDIDGEDTFSLADGDREPFQQMTFNLADEQAEFIKQKIEEAKKKEEYKYLETFGNENSNGNALYFLVHGSS